MEEEDRIGGAEAGGRDVPEGPARRARAWPSWRSARRSRRSARSPSDPTQVQEAVDAPHPRRGDAVLRRGGRGARADPRRAGPPRGPGPDRRRGHVQPDRHARLGDRRRPPARPAGPHARASAPRTRSRATPSAGWPRRPAASTTRPGRPTSSGRSTSSSPSGSGRATPWSTGPTASSPTAPSGPSASSTAPSRQAGETAVFIPGMVVPAPGWPRLFLALVLGLLVLGAGAPACSPVGDRTVRTG